MIKHTPKQEDALRVLGSDARHILLRGGARCVAGDTVLDGHSRTIAELARDGLPVIVRTSWGEQLAEAPFLKGWAELYRVCLSDGREVTVTSDHRFWTDRGWQPLSALGSVLGSTRIAVSVGRDGGGAPPVTSDVPSADGYAWAGIAAIERPAAGNFDQPYYTLHVPGCEHYFANGVLHHNSGKTVILMEAVLTRALAAPGSRHAVLRYRANSLKSITGPTGTLYYVLDNCFPPEVRERGRYHAQDDYYQLLNGSEVWFGGLDDPKRVDKILGWEFSSLYFNEVSQIPWGSYTTAMTRLAQTAKLTGGGTLRQKAYLDCNPPPETHWVNRLFIEKRDPDTKRPLADPAAYATVMINPEDNRENLDPAFLESLRNLPERQRKRFYLGQFGDAGEAALWTSELLDQQRILDASKLPEFARIVVAIDPSGADDIEDTGADEIGIVVAGLGENGAAYILEDLTMRGSPGEWGAAATAAYDRHGANTIVGESNFGGAMVRHVIQTAKPGVPYKEVTASRGKHIRAEPVSALFESRKVWMVGRFPELEDEMTAMTTAGYTGTKSPNRLDAMVWAVSELFPGIIRQAKREDGGLARPMVPKVNLGHSASKRYREARRW